MTKSYFKIERKITENQAGMLLRDFLFKEEKISRRAVKAIKFGEGDLLVNGERKTVRYVLKRGDHLVILFPPEAPSPSLIGEPMPLDILFEDEHLLVINKPAGIPVIPSQMHPHGTLANGVLFHFEQQGLSYTVHTVTRLDRDTSGVMLIAKHRHAHELFVREQKKHKVERSYQALVHGNISPMKGIIDAPIDRKEGSIIERCVTPSGKRAVTHYEVLKQAGEISLLKIKLETGRTHQIRVHFSHEGHPLLGDDLYGGERTMISRQALHSYQLKFLHPFHNKEMIFEAACPPDMKTIIDKL